VLGAFDEQAQRREARMKRHNIRLSGQFATRIDLVRRQMRTGEQVALALGRAPVRTVRERLVAAMGRMGVQP
jgi:Flp pilus assembly protein TadB